jgi:hypothetical protein
MKLDVPILSFKIQNPYKPEGLRIEEVTIDMPIRASVDSLEFIGMRHANKACLYGMKSMDNLQAIYIRFYLPHRKAIRSMQRVFVTLN